MDDSMSTSLILKVAEFLAHEADLLDSGKFDEWLNLFDLDAIYWIPTSSDQTDMKGQVSIILEDVPLLKLRIQRLSHPRAYSVTPPPETVHLIGNVTVAKQNKTIITNSKLIVTEAREDLENRFTGSVTHELRPLKGGFRIKSKRIDLLQSGGSISVISVPL